MTSSSHTPMKNLSNLTTNLIIHVKDLNTLKCILRALDILAKTDNQTTPIKQKRLLKDDLLLQCIGEPNKIMKALQHALQIGLLSQHVDLDNEIEYRLIYSDVNDYNQNKKQKLDDHNLHVQPSSQSAGIFKLYEENIGLLTPLVAESLAEAENRYSSQWILEAFKLAITRNKRSWAYISRILERWFIEGKTYGDSRKYSKKVTAAEYIQRHGLPEK